MVHSSRMTVPHLVKTAASQFLASGDGDSLRVFEARFKVAVTEAAGDDQKVMLLDEAAHGELPERDGRRQVILDFVERQRRILRGELS